MSAIFPRMYKLMRCVPLKIKIMKTICKGFSFPITNFLTLNVLLIDLYRYGGVRAILTYSSKKKKR